MCPIIRSGDRSSTPATWRARRARTNRTSPSSRTPSSSNGSPTTLATGRVVGWMDGATEFGPRALGHRSILAAPHSVDMRDRLNRDIKYREEFRPFAPVVPVEAADRYFELPPGGARLSRFMSGVFPVRPEWRERLAAVTHVDGSARVQVLERDMAPRLHALLEAYGRRTGIPVLLNTSFNLSGEPIVTRALEGYSSFRRCGIDLLVAGPTLVSKRAVREREAGEGGRRMVVRKRGGIRRRLIMLGLGRRLDRRISSAACGAASRGNRWLLPLAVFLCLFGAVLILATTVEALAPFIYAIF